MSRAGSMTGLATDTDLGKPRSKGIRHLLEALCNRSGMTVGAHMIPILARRRPMQHIVRLTNGFFLQVIPTSTTLTRIPNHWQGL